jgi:hypothetical protein
MADNDEWDDPSSDECATVRAGKGSKATAAIAECGNDNVQAESAKEATAASAAKATVSWEQRQHSQQ